MSQGLRTRAKAEGIAAIIQARCRGMSRRRMVAKPRHMNRTQHCQIGGCFHQHTQRPIMSTPPRIRKTP